MPSRAPFLVLGRLSIISPSRSAEKEEETQCPESDASCNFDQLAKLAEEARIASQIASANLRIITRAGTPVSEGKPTRQNVPLAGAIGLILSVFVVFVVEYVSKARARQAAGWN
ncbi:MAG: hypothetical protein VX911_08995 [Candidatus Latescibacterota bacterium]|nr:hypothetical protein [Candidatus Latescibacterota bacterium]